SGLPPLHPFPTRRSSDLVARAISMRHAHCWPGTLMQPVTSCSRIYATSKARPVIDFVLADFIEQRPPGPEMRNIMPHSTDQVFRSEEHTSELQSRENLVC